MKTDSALDGTNVTDKYRIVELLFDETRVSRLNPRFGYVADDESFAGLAGELKVVGQARDATAIMGEDGVPEILSGSRRREACRIIGRPLRVRIIDKVNTIQALKIANREDNASVAVSFWDKSASWQRTLDEKLVPTDAKLADAVGESPSSISRGIALQNAPAELLALFPDKRALSQTQWFALAPLLEDPATRERILARAEMLAGRSLSVPAVTKELKAAAADKKEIRATEVRNRHGKVIAIIRPDHRGGFAISVKTMTEAHPSYRVDFARLIHERFLEVIKESFGKDG